MNEFILAVQLRQCYKVKLKKKNSFYFPFSLIPYCNLFISMCIVFGKLLMRTKRKLCAYMKLSLAALGLVLGLVNP